MTTDVTAQRILHLGIDPGLQGALAVLDDAGALVAVHDVPILMLKTNRGTRREYDLPSLGRLLKPYAEPGAHAIVEESQAMPKQGVASTFVIGVGFGVWLGLLGALEIPYTRVRPAVWKKTLGLRGKDKEAARLRAQQLFPGADLQRKKDHGRAEALLLAHWGLLHVAILAT